MYEFSQCQLHNPRHNPLFVSQTAQWPLPLVFMAAGGAVFAISPNSASCERVFALLKNLFGEEQSLSLADYVQALLMLNYNDRSVG